MVVNFSNYNNLRSTQTNSVNNSAFNKKFLLNFCGLKTLDRDTVELSSKKIENNKKKSETPQYPLAVKIKDSEGKTVDAVITDITAKPKLSRAERIDLMLNPDIWNDKEKRKALLDGTYAEKYLKNDSTKLLELTVNGTHIAGINLSLKDDHIYVEYLYNNKRGLGYKGTGTELLKCAVRESIDKGFGGKLRLTATPGKDDSPLPFYYKNNLSFEDDIAMEARTLGVVQGEFPLEFVFSSTKQPHMILDEEGAKALLEGKRLCQGTKLDKIDEKVINGNNCSAYLFESKDGSDKCVLVPCIEEYEDEDGNKCEDLEFISVELKEQNDNKGNKHFVITKILGSRSYKDELNFAMETIEKLEKKYNCDKTTIKYGYLNKLKKMGYSKQIDVE